MQNKHPVITFAYHFMSEAIILFFVLLPIMYYYFEWVPYGSYFAIAVGVCFVFSAYVKLSDSYMLYIISAPIMMVIFYLSGYPIALSIAFSVILTWRYINIRSETILERENGYIRITLLLATALVLLTNDYQVVLYAFLQFLILIVGYISSHLSVIKKEERKRFDKKLWLYISFVFTAGTVIVFLLFDSGRYVFLKAGEWLSYIAAIVASKASVLFQFMDFDKAVLPDDSSPIVQQQERLSQMEQGEASFLEKILPFIYWIIIILITGFVIFLAVRIFKNRFMVTNQVGASEAVSYGDLEGDMKDKRNFMKNMFRSYFNKHDHPVRKLVYQFEKTAIKNGYGRNPFETLEDWFDRIGINVNLTAYQDVRYGEKDVTDNAMNTLKEQLQRSEAKLKDRKIDINA